MSEALINTLRSFGKAYPEEAFAPLRKEDLAEVVKAYPGLSGWWANGKDAVMQHVSPKNKKQVDALSGKCVRCTSFQNSNERGFGCCVRNVAAFKEMTGKVFSRGAPEGPSFQVRKLDGCKLFGANECSPCMHPQQVQRYERHGRFGSL